MSSQLSIQAALPVLGSGVPAQSAAPTQALPVSPPAQAASPAAKPVPLFTNPSSQFDPTVGLVVLDFHNDSGTVTSSIPSERQLEAYRTGLETPPGEPVPKLP